MTSYAPAYPKKVVKWCAHAPLVTSHLTRRFNTLRFYKGVAVIRQAPLVDSSPTRPFPERLRAFFSVLLDQKHPGDNDSVRRFTVLCTSKSRRSCRTRLDSADNSASRDWLLDRTRIVGASARKGAGPVFPFHLSFEASPDEDCSDLCTQSRFAACRGKL